MKKLLAIIVLGLLFSGNANAIANWEIKKVMNDTFTEVSTGGSISKGDKYRLHISNNGRCDVLEDGFTFFTKSNNPDIIKLEGKKIGIKAFGMNNLSEIKTVARVLKGGGHIVWITNGVFDVEPHAKFLEENGTLEVELVRVFDDYKKQIGWDAKEFFDVLTNSWNLKNVSKALKQGQKICLDN